MIFGQFCWLDSANFSSSSMSFAQTSNQSQAQSGYIELDYPDGDGSRQTKGFQKTQQLQGRMVGITLISNSFSESPCCVNPFVRIDTADFAQ